MAYVKRKSDKIALGALVTTILGILVILTYVVNTSKWAQATDDTITHCQEKIITVDSKTNLNKAHIKELVEQRGEDQRFRGQIEAKIDSIQDSQVRQEAMIMQLIRNSNKIISNGHDE